jgi:hypothetical protein
MATVEIIITEIICAIGVRDTLEVFTLHSKFLLHFPFTIRGTPITVYPVSIVTYFVIGSTTLPIKAVLFYFLVSTVMCEVTAARPTAYLCSITVSCCCICCIAVLRGCASTKPTVTEFSSIEHTIATPRHLAIFSTGIGLGIGVVCAIITLFSVLIYTISALNIINAITVIFAVTRTWFKNGDALLLVITFCMCITYWVIHTRASILCRHFAR